MNNKTLNKHEERAQYILDNKLTIAEAAALLQLDSSTIRKSIKSAGEDWKIKIDSMLKWRKCNIGQKTIKNNKQTFLYEERAMKIINNKKATSYKKAAQIIGITEDQLVSSITLLKLNNKFLYEKFHSVMQERYLESRRYMKITNYIIKHSKCNRDEVCKKFNCSDKTLSTVLFRIKYQFPDKYKKAISILNKNKNPKYKQVAQYIIDNNATNSEAAKYFNITLDAVYTNLNFLCKLYEPKMFKIIKRMRMKSKNK